MKLHLKQFKKLHSDKHVTVLQHPDGHELTIAHAHLSPKMRAEVESMPMHASGKDMGEPPVQKLADGGGVASTIAPKDIEQFVPNYNDKVLAEKLSMGQMNQPPGQEQFMPMDTGLEQFQGPAESQVIEKELAQKAAPDQANFVNWLQNTQSAAAQNDVRAQAGAPMTPMPEQQKTLAQRDMAQASPQGPQEPQDLFGTKAYVQAYGQGLEEQKAGILAGMDAESAMARAQAHAIEKNIKAQEALNTSFQQTKANLMAERQGLIEDIQNQKVDPNKFWTEKTLPSKISTAIGLILGGIGGGLMHQENPALKLLNANIEREIQAQKLNIENKHTLLNANRAQFANEHDAANMTRLMLMDQVSNELKMAAAKTADPMVRARALQALGQLDMQSAPLMSQLSMRQAVLGGAKNGAIDPASAIRVIVPEGQQAGAFKELQEAQNVVMAKNNILSAFDKLNQINTVGGLAISPIQTQKQVAAIRDPLIASLSKATAGRFTEQDAKMIEPLFPAKGDSAKTIAQKRNQLNQIISEKLHFPTLEAYGINVGSMGRFNAAGQSRIPTTAPQIK